MWKHCSKFLSITLKMLHYPPQNCSMKQNFSEPCPKPGWNIFTLLCTCTPDAPPSHSRAPIQALAPSQLEFSLWHEPISFDSFGSLDRFACSFHCWILVSHATWTTFAKREGGEGVSLLALGRSKKVWESETAGNCFRINSLYVVKNRFFFASLWQKFEEKKMILQSHDSERTESYSLHSSFQLRYSIQTALHCAKARRSRSTFWRRVHFTRFPREIWVGGGAIQIRRLHYTEGARGNFAAEGVEKSDVQQRPAFCSLSPALFVG